MKWYVYYEMEGVKLRDTLKMKWKMIKVWENAKVCGKHHCMCLTSSKPLHDALCDKIGLTNWPDMSQTKIMSSNSFCGSWHVTDKIFCRPTCQSEFIANKSASVSSSSSYMPHSRTNEKMSLGSFKPWHPRCLAVGLWKGFSCCYSSYSQ